MKPTQILMLVVCANMWFGVKLDDDDDDDDNLPVLSAKTVFDSVADMLNSPSESLKEVAKNTLESFKSQMDDKSKQYAKLTLNGIRFAVNMGSSGSALRSENEAMLLTLWNQIVSFFYNILNWFGFGHQQYQHNEKKISCKQTLNTNEVDNNYYIEDAIFMKTALQQQLCEIEEILFTKQAILKYVKDNSITISETGWTRIEQDNFFELEYRNKLKQSIDLLDEEIGLVDKQVEAEKEKQSNEDEV